MTNISGFIKDLHSEQIKWLEELASWKEESYGFEEHLNKIIPSIYNSSDEANIHESKNNIIQQNEQIEQLISDIIENENNIVEYLINNPIDEESDFFSIHIELRTRMAAQENIFNNLKREYEKHISI